MDALDPTVPQCVVRTLVLTDLENSTALTERLGDRGTAAVIAQHDRLARGLLAAHRGQEIDKSDGFLLLFEDPVDALAWCLTYHRRLAELATRLGLPLAARAGMHVGEVVTWHNPPEDVANGAKPVEVEGIAKPVAARVMSAGGGGQTLLTASAWQAVGAAKQDARLLGPGAGDGELGWVSHGPYAFKGVSEPVELYEVGQPGIAPLAPPPGSGKVRPWTSPNNLPAPPSAFVGRQRELEDLDLLVEIHPLITLLGPGGTGKTRLSLEAARAALPRFPGGAWFCEVEGARDRDAFCAAVAQALDVPLTRGDPVALLGAAIAGRGAVLLVLDNLEQVVADAADVLAAWIQAAPEARILASSREPLQIAREHRYPLDALPTDAAVDLFCDRAAAVRPGFALDAAGRGDVEALVAELDGMPLAIELAAARARTLSPAAIRERLSRRFELLRGKRRDVSGRQATLEGAIDWSWELLSGEERLALASCSAFPASFDAEAAEEVLDLSAFPDADWPMDVCEALVDKSLLRSIDGPDGGVRLSMYSSIRAYAAARLSEPGAVVDADGASLTGPDAEAAVRRRHAAFYARLGEDRALHALHGPDGLRGLRRLSRELPNLRAAVAHGAPADAARAALAAAEVMQIEGPFADGAALAAAAGQRPGLEPALASRLRIAEGFLRKFAGDAASARTLLEQAHGELSGTVHGAVAAQRLGELLRDQGEGDRAEPLLEEAAAICAAAGDAWGEGVALAGLAALYMGRNQLGRAQELSERALALLQVAGAERSQAHVLGTLAVLHALRGELRQAAALMTRARDLHRAVGNRRAEGLLIANLGFVRYELGDYDGAFELISRALQIAREVGNALSEPTALIKLAVVRRAQQAPMEARRYGQSALALARASGSLRDQGRALAELARLDLDAGQHDAAREHVRKGLELARQARDAPAIVTHLGLQGELDGVGDLDAGLAPIDEALAMVERAGQKGPQAELLLARARVLRAHGRDAHDERSRAAALVAALDLPAESPLARELARD
ncbi:MAG: tetratricopeptide repeat protein [Alphaproteobacteria bacterium]|nr:tetratricopeptide repeat protein [Alphaproteobacteria bacterium]